MNKIILLTIIATLLTAAQTRAQTISRAEYIDRYKHIAVAHAEKYGIPASIKMAQGMLESGNGNGTLARQGNTHFNIKVKASDRWTGPVVYHDDDRPNEAFRAYASAEESWVDHSEYLDNQPRYDSLFRHGATNYRAWAHGLKNCGYATDPQYAAKLIRIIEENNLWALDRGDLTLAGTSLGGNAFGGNAFGGNTFGGNTFGGNALGVSEGSADAGSTAPTEATSATTPASTAEDGTIDVDNYVIAMYFSGGRDLLRTPHGRFIVAKTGDTLRSISRLTGIRAGLLSRYNRLDKNTPLNAGQKIKIG